MTLDQIKSGDRKILKELYATHREPFGTWARKVYQIDDEMIAEIYQRAFTALYFNVKAGKLDNLTSSIRTYLFAIGKNLIRDQFKSGRRTESLDADREKDDQVDVSVMDRYEENDMKETVRRLLDNIGEPCKTVLHLFYFRQYSMEAIAHEMNYKTEQIAAKRKFICLKQMRDLINRSPK